VAGPEGEKTIRRAGYSGSGTWTMRGCGNKISKQQDDGTTGSGKSPYRNYLKGKQK
jgi:hypothetical protein